MFELAILKLTSFCNLDCSYCYMFNQKDRTFQKIANNMAEETALRCLDRIQEHCSEYGRDVFHLTLHGGEPSLWPVESFTAFLGRVDELRAGGLNLSVSMQTNGLRMSNKLLDLFSSFDVTLGISLDGPAWSNDEKRVTKSGRGSYQRVMATVDKILSSRHADVLHGFLSVCQPEISPVEYYDWVKSLPIPRMDILWPLHYNYANPPWTTCGLEEYSRLPRYGSWFGDVFDLWWDEDDPSVYVRFFYECLFSLLGSNRHIESIVNDRVPIIVVNTDGGIEYHDYFRSFEDGATRTPYTIHQNSLTEVTTDPVFDYLLNLGAYMPAECSGCSHSALCGGGFLAGRMEHGVDLPRRKSVLCLDEFHFFGRVNARLRRTAQVENKIAGRMLSRDRPELRQFSPQAYFADMKFQSAPI